MCFSFTFYRAPSFFPFSCSRALSFVCLSFYSLSSCFSLCHLCYLEKTADSHRVRRRRLSCFGCTDVIFLGNFIPIGRHKCTGKVKL